MLVVLWRKLARKWRVHKSGDLVTRADVTRIIREHRPTIMAGEVQCSECRSTWPCVAVSIAQQKVLSTMTQEME